MNKNKIKGSFFDFDGVITKERNGTPAMVSYIAEKTGIPFDAVNSAYRKYNKGLLLGNITHNEMWKPFCESLGYAIPYEVLVKSFMIVTLDEHMIQFIKEKHGEYQIGMITDNKAARIE